MHPDSGGWLGGGERLSSRPCTGKRRRHDRRPPDGCPESTARNSGRATPARSCGRVGSSGASRGTRDPTTNTKPPRPQATGSRASPRLSARTASIIRRTARHTRGQAIARTQVRNRPRSVTVAASNWTPPLATASTPPTSATRSGRSASTWSGRRRPVRVGGPRRTRRTQVRSGDWVASYNRLAKEPIIKFPREFGGEISWLKQHHPPGQAPGCGPEVHQGPRQDGVAYLLAM